MLPDLIIRQHFIYKLGNAGVPGAPAGRKATSQTSGQARKFA
jgi:hypothetical protein